MQYQKSTMILQLMKFLYAHDGCTFFQTTSFGAAGLICMFVHWLYMSIILFLEVFEWTQCYCYTSMHGYLRLSYLFIYLFNTLF